jgi:hypothetical protein
VKHTDINLKTSTMRIFDLDLLIASPHFFLIAIPFVIVLIVAIKDSIKEVKQLKNK